jgi:hypothetical protein
MGKPVIETNTRILNLDRGFQHKYLCAGPTFSAGTAYAYRCLERTGDRDRRDGSSIA